jgi:ABC-type transport system substrate-binding protein
MNLWLSSAEMHQWNPRQTAPATPWEAEIDRLMKTQASELNPKLRKKMFDRVQQIASEQQPMIYLIYKDALSAIRPTIANATPVVLRPQTYWNAERLAVRIERAAK